MWKLKKENNLSEIDYHYKQVVNFFGNKLQQNNRICKKVYFLH